MSSLTADPVNQLLQDIKNTDEYERFTVNGKTYTLESFPDTFALNEKRFYDLKARKKALLKTSGTDQAEINQLDQAYQTEKDKLLALETQVEENIKTRLGQLRTKLKTEFKIDAATSPNFGSGTDANDTNRLTLMQIMSLEHLLKQIRFLENSDEEADSSVANENTAMTKLADLKKKVSANLDTKISHVNYFNMLKDSDIEASLNKFVESGKTKLASGGE
jgi:hypothetical protein